MAGLTEPLTGAGIDPRTPVPERRLNLYTALAAGAAASVVYVGALLTGWSPPRGMAAVLFTAAPLCAVVALVVLARQAVSDADEALKWFAAGLGVGTVAMVLQLISFPVVAPGGGVLGTGAQSSAALYLLFHLAPAVGAAAGALQAPASARLPLLGVGVVVTALLALDVVPLPVLLEPDGGFSDLLVVLEGALAALVGACAVLWVRRVGRSPVALRGWVGICLSLAAYDVVLNALGEARFTPVWWASLSLRVATYATLAFGVLWTVLTELRDVMRYSRAELQRRESQLASSLTQTRRLLRCAEDLARAVTAEEVATVLCADVVAMSGLRHAAVVVSQTDGQLRVLGTEGYDAAMREWADRADWDSPLPAARAALTGESMFLSGQAQVRAQFPKLATSPVSRASSLAALPLVVRSRPVGALVVWDTETHHWDTSATELLAGLAAQGGQAVARARAYEEAMAASATLQASLLPSRLPQRDDLAMAARYVAGEGGLGVGGDWYDCVEVDDHRVGLVVGDVMGKGLHATAVMGQMRTTLRALTAVDPAPAAVLAAMDRVTRELDPDEVATVVYILLDLSTGLARIGRAGHLPPLLAVPGASARMLDAGGSPPLGAAAGRWEETAVWIPTGGLLVLFSDGMVGDRQRGPGPGLASLTAAVTELSASGAADLETMATELIGRVSGDRGDDMTLLVVRFLGAKVAAPQRTVP